MINVNDKLIKEALPIIGCEAFGVLMAITIHINAKRTAFPKVPRLMALTGLSRNKVYKAIGVLIDEGYLARWQEKEKAQFGRVLYRVTTKYLSIYMGVDEMEMEAENPLTYFGDAENGDTGFGDAENGDALSINKVGSINKNTSINHLVTMSGKPNERPSSNLFDLEAETQKEKNSAKKEKDVTAVIEYLNTAAERKFASDGKGSAANRDLVIGVLSMKKEKVEVQDCFDVVDMLCLKWKGDFKMKQYLQPQTIFAKANFLKYLSQVQEMKQNQNAARDVVNGMDRKNMTPEAKAMADRAKQQKDIEQTIALARELAEQGF